MFQILAEKSRNDPGFFTCLFLLFGCHHIADNGEMFVDLESQDQQFRVDSGDENTENRASGPQTIHQRQARTALVDGGNEAADHCNDPENDKRQY